MARRALSVVARAKRHRVFSHASKSHARAPHSKLRSTRVKKSKADPEPWEIDPKKIRYKEKLARGNFGEVWVGQWLGSPVAIKTVLASMASDDEFIQRFVLEIELTPISCIPHH